MHASGYERLTENCALQDVLVTLLNNLKVQERQNRVCTTVAIAIVAETCSPFTVLPALMNEYKVSPLQDTTPCSKASRQRHRASGVDAASDQSSEIVSSECVRYQVAQEAHAHAAQDI